MRIDYKIKIHLINILHNFINNGFWKYESILRMLKEFQLTVEDKNEIDFALLIKEKDNLEILKMANPAESKEIDEASSKLIGIIALVENAYPNSYGAPLPHLTIINRIGIDLDLVDDEEIKTSINLIEKTIFNNKGLITDLLYEKSISDALELINNKFVEGKIDKVLFEFIKNKVKQHSGIES